MCEFNLTFTEALQVLYNDEGWVQGEAFKSGVVMAIDYNHIVWDKLHGKDFTAHSSNREFMPSITKRIMGMKYRVVHTESESYFSDQL